MHKHGHFDVAVCNPPFFRPEWNRSFADILRCGDLSDAARTVNKVTAEVLFIAQSLSLLKPEGRLAVIVPDSLITTERARHFRNSILRNHLVEKVLQLPINSFMDTDAQCYIVFVKKGVGPSRNVKLYRVGDSHGISAAVTVSAEAAENRMDFNFHSLVSERSEKHTNLRALGAEVFRGSISTVQRKTATFPVFHTSEYRDILDGKIMLPQSGRLSDLGKIVAEPGDILLARVDRNLHEKIGIVVSGAAVITDCVYRIRLPEQSRQIAFDALCSDSGRRNLRALTKGVGARIIGKANLLVMPLTIGEAVKDNI